jgi:trehalose/maltose hydrolase-like predicted phosphorylase
MSVPLSPPPVTHAGQPELPAYVANGLIGIRVLDIPLLPGIVMVSGFSGLHPMVQVEAAANAPYPLAGDIGIDRVWLGTNPHQAEFEEQRYDFSCGELTTRFAYRANGITARVEVLTFCSKTDPTLALQEVSIEVDGACDLTLRASVDPGGVRGRMDRRNVELPGTDKQIIDGSMCWSSLGELSRCGVAYVTELVGDPTAEKQRRDRGLQGPLATEFRISARSGRQYRLRQIASVVPSVLHEDPDREATRLVGRAIQTGFDVLRARNRAEWEELWKGRVLVTADDDQWQRLADAAVFYLNTSVHRSAPSSTSMYGLAQWIDYHYYYGHVMWDIETFAVPPLLVQQPAVARSLLSYRTETISAARANAKLQGRGGLQFTWESGPLRGQEATPVPGTASWHEDHVSLDVAHAFAQYAYVTGDERFARDEAAPVLYGVADWITTRVERTANGYSIPKTMGIAERTKAADNDAFTIMSAKVVLREAVELARRLGDPVSETWVDVAAGLNVRISPRSNAIMTHDGFHPREEKGSTPDPLAGLFPLGFEVDRAVEKATIRYFLKLAPDYIGSPMLSPLYGVWAAWLGDRATSARLFQQGYADLVAGRFLQTLEHSIDKFPEKPPSGPFFANLGGFLGGLIFGLPGLRLGPGNPETWPVRPVVLPTGWQRVEVERAWLRGKPGRIIAEHGMRRAVVEVREPHRRRKAA